MTLRQAACIALLVWACCWAYSWGSDRVRAWQASATQAMSCNVAAIKASTTEADNDWTRAEDLCRER